MQTIGLAAALFEANDSVCCGIAMPEQEPPKLIASFSSCFTVEIAFDDMNDIGVQLKPRASRRKIPSVEITLGYKGYCGSLWVWNCRSAC